MRILERFRTQADFAAAVEVRETYVSRVVRRRLRPPRESGQPLPAPPRFDPGYPAAGQVSIRDLAVYAAIAEGGAA